MRITQVHLEVYSKPIEICRGKQSTSNDFRNLNFSNFIKLIAKRLMLLRILLYIFFPVSRMAQFPQIVVTFIPGFKH